MKSHDSLESQLRRDAASFTPEASPELSRRIHRAIVEAAHHQRASTALPSWLRFFAGGLALTVIAVAIAIYWPSQKPSTPPVQVVNTTPPVLPLTSVEDWPDLVQSPLDRELSALADDAKHLTNPLMFLTASPVNPQQATQPANP